MLMMEHKSDIDHILHDLEQIEYSKFDTNKDRPVLENNRRLAKEAIDELVALLSTLEDEEFSHSGIVYDSKMIEDMSLIAYYMSLYGYQGLFDELVSLEEACVKCSMVIGCSSESLLNMKYMYDNYLINEENKWPQNQSLTNDMMFIIHVSESMTEEEMATSCKRIIGFWQ